jgi:VanZ family protein
VGSLLPSNSLPKRALDALDVNDKLEHFLAYSALALLPALHEKKPVAALMALAIAVLGVTLEFGQVLFSDRLFELGDIAAGTAGVLCGFVAATQLRPRLTKGAWGHV